MPCRRSCEEFFFEVINLSADGGIYPEFVRNRFFEDAARSEYWMLLNVTNFNSQIWEVENNLSIANMDFNDFFNAVDKKGVYRGI
jgi:hypothetical protein